MTDLANAAALMLLPIAILATLWAIERALVWLALALWHHRSHR